MEIKEAIDYLRTIADSAHLKQYSAALDTAIRCMEEVEVLRRELEQVKSERDRLRNEKCLGCGNYRWAHLGTCDGCRWKEG